MSETVGRISPSDLEFVDEADIQAAQRANRIAEHINYIDACNVFRANVFTKLKRHHPNFQGSAIALFRVDPGGSVATMGSNKEILLISAPHPLNSNTIEGHPIPTIRLFSEEWVSDENGNGDFICFDMSLDSANNSQYFVGSSHGMDGQREAFHPTDPSFDVGKDFVPPRSALTYMADPMGDKVWVSHSIDFFTDAIRVYGLDDAGSPRKVLPFGHWGNIADRQEALGVGMAMIAEIENIDPTVIRLE